MEDAGGVENHHLRSENCAQITTNPPASKGSKATEHLYCVLFCFVKDLEMFNCRDLEQI